MVLIQNAHVRSRCETLSNSTFPTRATSTRALLSRIHCETRIPLLSCTPVLRSRPCSALPSGHLRYECASRQRTYTTKASNRSGWRRDDSDAIVDIDASDVKVTNHEKDGQESNPQQPQEGEEEGQEEEEEDDEEPTNAVVKMFHIGINVLLASIFGPTFYRLLMRAKHLSELYRYLLPNPEASLALAEGLLVGSTALYLTLAVMDAARDLKLGRAALDQTANPKLLAAIQLRLRWLQVKLVMTAVGTWMVARSRNISLGLAIVFASQALFASLALVQFDNKSRVHPWAPQERLFAVVANVVAVGICMAARYTGNKSVALGGSCAIAIGIAGCAVARLVPWLLSWGHALKDEAKSADGQGGSNRDDKWRPQTE
eukprot:jgi/Mesvir1/19171/Mv01191-RA.1